MLTIAAARRTWTFSHAIGRIAESGEGFTHPTAVAAASEGIIYVLNRGRDGYSSASKRIGKFAIGAPGEEEFICDLAAGDFDWPAGLALDSDENVYCSDEYKGFVAVYAPDGRRLGQWGEPGHLDGQLRGPSGLAFDGEDNLYVADSLNNRVEKFTRGGKSLMGWGGSGSNEGQLDRPWGITVDRNGDVYVADWGNDRVQKFSPDGAPLLSFGDSDGDETGLDHPADVAVDRAGDVYVADWGNKRVQIYDSDGDVLTALYGDATGFTKWLGSPGGKMIDSQARVYHRFADQWQFGSFNRPRGIAVDERDRIIVADNNRARLQVYAKGKG